MHKTLTLAAALSTLVLPAIAAPDEAPYALSAEHAEFQAQLEWVAERPGAIGLAARTAADLMLPHNAAQERLVLPLLVWADAAAAAHTVTVPDLPNQMRLEAELSQLYDGDVKLVTALVELYATADEAGDAETARLAETVVWHETSDIEVLYPAALLVASAIRAQSLPTIPAADQVAPGPQPVPMMGVGNPHGPGAGN